VDAALILADQLLQRIRDAGVTRQEALCALSVAKTTLFSLDDVPVTGQSRDSASDC
jgi:hypothetical protein